MYLDTDVILALLKADDWLASVVDLDDVDSPKTSVSTGIEVQYAMEGDWNRERLTRVDEAIGDAGVDRIPLESAHLEAGGALRRAYGRLNVFDAVHLGTARTLGEPICSTDSLYPEVDEIDHVDPRDVG